MVLETNNKLRDKGCLQTGYAKDTLNMKHYMSTEGIQEYLFRLCIQLQEALVSSRVLRARISPLAMERWEFTTCGYELPTHTNQVND